ncbi:MAG TPA: ABC transporter substrate-binding protein [Candidatus Limnocylindria bacterium]|jgi:peptide/nickel transport system substrate-binding protein
MRRSRIFPIIGAIGLALAACTTPQSSPSGGGGSSAEPSGGGTATGGTVKIGLPGYPDYLNPGLAVLAESYTIYELVYDTPITVTATGEFVPKLATEWSVSEDGLTWTVVLRDDATFHDGEPLDATDVAFSIELYRDTVFPLLTSYAEPFVDVTVVDETTIELTTVDPMSQPLFEGNLAAIYVLPEHIWASEDPLEFENAEMIGSGPFTLVEAQQGEFVQLATNPEYWGTVAAIDGVIFQTITNADARITALTNSQVDALTEFPATAISTLENAEDIVVNTAETPGGQLRDIFFNVTTAENCPTAEETGGAAGVCSGHPALKDVAVRRALAHATDKEQLIQVATLGTGSQGLSLVTRSHGDFFASEIEDYAFDIDEANRLLDDAGYEDTNGDGVRECLPDQDCDDLTFRLNFPDDSDTAPREADQLGDTWSQIGVAVQIQGFEARALTALCCPGFDYDIMIWSWYTDIDAGGLLAVATCEEIPSGFNETGYCNPEYDTLNDEQAVELDRDTRIAQIHELQQILIDDVVYIVPYYFVSIQAWRTDTFTGWIEGTPTIGLEDPTQLVVLRPNE